MEEAPLKQKKKSKAWRFVYVLFSSLHQNFEMVKLSRWKMKANFFAVEKNRKGESINNFYVLIFSDDDIPFQRRNKRQ